MLKTLAELKREIKLRVNNIHFDMHFYDRMKKRIYLNEELVKNSLNNFDNYLGFQSHHVKEKPRYRIGMRLSNKYVFVIVLEIEKEHLNIITAWKTNRKWQKTLQK
ncbi:MAG: hypothetical protein KJ600_05715 [Nanoarchaeota archaeon]|nr:hypothetical protein [Nanoarchaeota archaeon]MBU1104026.1 hypothetical protein [Nanoarchaeota archaeon]